MKIANRIYYHQHNGVEGVSFESQSPVAGAQRSANRLLFSAFTLHPSSFSFTLHPSPFRANTALY
jgi:hypothetical protein